MFFKDVILKLDLSIKLQIILERVVVPRTRRKRTGARAGLRVHLASCPFLLSHLPALSLDIPGDVSHARPMETEMPSLPPSGVARSGAIGLASWSWRLEPSVTAGHQLWWPPCPPLLSLSARGPLPGPACCPCPGCRMMLCLPSRCPATE